MRRRCVAARPAGRRATRRWARRWRRGSGRLESSFKELDMARTPESGVFSTPLPWFWGREPQKRSCAPIGKLSRGARPHPSKWRPRRTVASTFAHRVGTCCCRERGRKSRFYCQTCPYIYALKVVVSTEVPLEHKAVDDVLGGAEAWANADQTEANCPKCTNRRAYYQQLQIARRRTDDLLLQVHRMRLPRED